VYGYLLGTVQPDGEIKFQFREITTDKIPQAVTDRYGSNQVKACFEENKSPYTPEAPVCAPAALANR